MEYRGLSAMDHQIDQQVLLNSSYREYAATCEGISHDSGTLRGHVSRKDKVKNW